ncbi:ankyrin [Xylaria nigripes]|nr:ankyrin [Xylaria nigripes]
MASSPTSTNNATIPAAISPEVIELATKLYNAAREGQIDVFKEVLPAGLPANLTNDKGDTLLMLAAYYGHADLVKLLIQYGADPNRLNDKGQSPIAGAVFKKEDAVIDALLEGGADPEYGMPSAIQCIAMFKQQDKWSAKFGAAPGKGKASKTQ